MINFERPAATVATGYCRLEIPTVTVYILACRECSGGRSHNMTNKKKINPQSAAAQAVPQSSLREPSRPVPSLCPHIWRHPSLHHQPARAPRRKRITYRLRTHCTAAASHAISPAAAAWRNFACLASGGSENLKILPGRQTYLLKDPEDRPPASHTTPSVT